MAVVWVLCGRYFERVGGESGDVTLLILGPVEVTVDGLPVPFGRPQQRELLGLLALQPGRLIASAQIVDSMWGVSPPQTAISQVQNMMSALRGVLGSHGRIARRRAGYVLELEPERIDAVRFERLIAQATAGPATKAIGLLRKALGLWRGEPLADVHAPYANAAAAGLTERRLLAWEMLFELELATGDPAIIVPELTSIVTANPTRERLAGQLMTALYRCGRQADALHIFRNVRRYLADEHGLDPGPALREVERMVLRADLPPTTTVPDVSRFLAAASHAEKALRLQGIHPCGWFTGDYGPVQDTDLSAERAEVLALVRSAFQTGDYERAWTLARMMAPVLEAAALLDDWAEFATVGLAAAAAAGRRDWTAAIEAGLGTMCYLQGEWDRSRAHLERALSLWSGPANRRNAGYAYLVLAVAVRAMGKPGTESMLRQALEAGVAESDVVLETEALRFLAWADRDALRPRRGCERLRYAADRVSTLDSCSDRLRGQILHDLAVMVADLGDQVRATAILHHALATFRRLGDKRWEARARFRLSEIHTARGDFEAAEDELRQASTLSTGQASHWTQRAKAGLERVGLAREMRVAFE